MTAREEMSRRATGICSDFLATFWTDSLRSKLDLTMRHCLDVSEMELESINIAFLEGAIPYARLREKLHVWVETHLRAMEKIELGRTYEPVINDGGGAPSGIVRDLGDEGEQTDPVRSEDSGLLAQEDIFDG